MISELDYKRLVNCKYPICHKLLSKTLIAFKCFKGIPLVYLPSPMQVISSQNMIFLFKTIRTSEKRIFDYNKKQLQKSLMSKCKKHNKCVLDPGEVKFDQLNQSHISLISSPIPLDFSAGSLESLQFLDCYSHSQSSDFIFSNWKHFIDSKWKSVFWINLILAILYWCFMIITTCKMVFFRDNSILKIFSISLIAFFLLLELFQMISYSTYKAKLYFKSIWNWLDIIMFLLLLIYFFRQFKGNDKIQEVMGAFILIMVFYRGFSYLKIIKAFTSLVGIVDTVIRKMVVFFFILLYFYLATGFIYAQVDTSFNLSSYLVTSYIWVLFGGIEQDDFDSNGLKSIPIFFGTIIVTIILLNILIAYLSNLFSRLEDRQFQEELKERANIILDSEIFIFFMKNLAKKISKEKINKKSVSSFYYYSSLK